VGLLGLLIARSPGTALGALALVVGAVACLEIDSRDVEVVDENAGEGNGSTSGQGGTTGGKGGAATGGTTGGGGAMPGSGATNPSGGSGNVTSTGGSASGAAPSTGGAGGAGSAGGAGGSNPGAGGGTMGGSGGTQGGSGGAGGMGGSSSPGTGGSGGAGGSGGTPVTCTGPRTELTIDGTHWMPGECNDYEIQGAWYCFTDEIADTDCDKVAGPRYDATLVGYCLSGTTIVDPEFKSWGATLAFELQSAPGVGKSSYDAAAHAVIGFDITVQGITSGLPLRIGFTPSATNMDATPFVEFAPLADETRTLTALIEEAQVPPDWDVPTAGNVADPTSIADVQLQIPGGQVEAPYQVCITHVKPILVGK
jgi:hypothetical protein